MAPVRPQLPVTPGRGAELMRATVTPGASLMEKVKCLSGPSVVGTLSRRGPQWLLGPWGRAKAPVPDRGRQTHRHPHPVSARKMEGNALCGAGSGRRSFTTSPTEGLRPPRSLRSPRRGQGPTRPVTSWFLRRVSDGPIVSGKETSSYFAFLVMLRDQQGCQKSS